jgi:hypothetical protein
MREDAPGCGRMQDDVGHFKGLMVVFVFFGEVF